MGRVIWITGAPHSGKTTVASALRSRLQSGDGGAIVHLDGDLLRVVLGRSSVEAEQERRELGCVYARLAKSLARQGNTVIMSAVAMYDEVFRELESEPTCDSVLILLSADAVSLRRRSGQLATNPIKDDWQLPNNIVKLDNSDQTDVEKVVDSIEIQLKKSATTKFNDVADVAIRDEILAFGRSRSIVSGHWDRFYTESVVANYPSPFAEWLVEKRGGKFAGGVLDFGCGNGRDAAFLAKFGPTLGVDAATSAIEYCHAQYLELSKSLDLQFQVADHDSLHDLLYNRSFSVFYSRFVWHAMTPEQELSVLHHMRDFLPVGAIVAIEARTTKDPMANRGAKLSARERSLGHYRRFIDVAELEQNISGLVGCVVDEIVEGHGLATFGVEDPHVVRIIARKI